METTAPIQTKLCTVTETSKIHFVGGQIRSITNPRRPTAAILKNRKRPYLRNALTDSHKIWHNDACWTSEWYGQLKFSTFKRHTIWHDAAFWSCEWYGQLTFWTFKIEDGGRTPSWKINKRPNLQNGLTDLHEIWHDVANWHCKAYWQLEFQTSENPLPSPLLPFHCPFSFPLLFSCSLPSTLNPCHSSTLPSLTFKTWHLIATILMIFLRINFINFVQTQQN